MNEQAKNQKRVAARIDRHVFAFLRERLGESMTPAKFYMSELTDHVTKAVGRYVAPDSPGRILRQMRKSGRVEVDLLDRALSLYEVRSLATRVKISVDESGGTSYLDDERI